MEQTTMSPAPDTLLAVASYGVPDLMHAGRRRVRIQVVLVAGHVGDYAAYRGVGSVDAVRAGATSWCLRRRATISPIWSKGGIVNNEEVPCWNCGGRGSIWTHLAKRPERSEWRDLRCQICDGVGWVAPWRLAQWQESRRRRTLRLAANLSGHEMAARLGMDPVTYNHCEHARSEWPAGSEIIFAALADETPLPVAPALGADNPFLEL